MCIVLVTTAHPSYPLIILDNRDEFILRPTSRPHWWSENHQKILSSRDLQRKEQGTWLGITKSGNFAVLTNYRETDTHDVEHPIQGTRSRGGMVTAWLTAPEDESTQDFVHRLLDGEGVAGVGGFSLLCGKLRKHKDAKTGVEPLAIISNRCGTSEDVPWIAERRGEVYGLSNTVYDDPITWPKVRMGKEKVLEAVQGAVESGLGEQELVDRLFAVLDHDTLPKQEGGDFEEYIYQLRHSIFIPSIGIEEPKTALKPDATASPEPKAANGVEAKLATEMNATEAPTPTPGVMSGIYATQRQTIILVDWEGNVTYRERSLWEADGTPIERGKGDEIFDFKIEGWNGERKEIG
ncbi:NRDE protein-domain-containing protein [Amylocarpus encephaloides]|uniref:NRDE protein-domain-containing protein n=1 Tax=Amylocarpus encephaloides TaxID=45428 RepID=A0A9P7YEU2_9HELO|nr:NRDE protein-domain-containing protein [Amylocarpus encephaloides]